MIFFELSRFFEDIYISQPAKRKVWRTFCKIWNPDSLANFFQQEWDIVLFSQQKRWGFEIEQFPEMSRKGEKKNATEKLRRENWKLMTHTFFTFFYSCEAMATEIFDTIFLGNSFSLPKFWTRTAGIDEIWQLLIVKTSQ